MEKEVLAALRTQLARRVHL